MKKIGIILAALVITTLFVGAVAALPANNPPDQREKFIEISAVQGVGKIFYEKKILDKEIAIDVYERMEGDTGENGSFAMTIYEILNEGVRLNCSGTCDDMGNMTDPIYGDAHRPVMTNFESKKMVQFETKEEEWNTIASVGLSGTATYNSPGFYTGLNAKVIENYGKDVKRDNGDYSYSLRSLQKDEVVKMTTTATYKDIPREWENCEEAEPYNANELNFDTKNAFDGAWETKSRWKKVCNKDVEHHQRFIGQFQVDKNLIFKEEVTKPCPEKVTHEGGDC